MRDHDELILAWLDDRAAAVDRDQLEHLLRSDSAVALRFAELARLHHDLHIAATALAVEQPSARFARPRHRGQQARRTPVLPWAAAAAALMLGLFLVTRSQSPAPAAWISGSAALPIGAVCTDTIQLRRSDQATVIAGRGRIVIADDHEGPALRLEYGSLECEVAKQEPGQSLRIFTPNADIRVVGTAFTISADAQRSSLAVREGLVRFRADAGRFEQWVSAGETLSWPQQDRDPIPDSPTQPARMGSIRGFRLVDAVTQADLMDLHDGQNIILDALPHRQINVVAVVEGMVGSVAMRCNDAILQKNGRGFENTPPFALIGNDAEHGRYHAWEPEPGTYVLSAIPFPEREAMGEPGRAMKMTVIVK